jgi:hypothetical protein
MYGLLIEAIIACIKTEYGLNIWEQVKKRAKLDNEDMIRHQQYSEASIRKIVTVLESITGGANYEDRRKVDHAKKKRLYLKVNQKIV